MQHDFFTNLDRLRMPDQQIVKHSEAKPERMPSLSRSRRVKGEFLKGPIPLSWLSSAAKLPGKAPLAVALAIMFESGRRKSNEIVLTTAICKRFDVNRKAKYRGLEKLEEANLIDVHRQPRKNPVVTIIDAGNQQPTEANAQGVPEHRPAGSQTESTSSKGECSDVRVEND
jgi:hypothetical protein